MTERDRTGDEATVIAPPIGPSSARALTIVALSALLSMSVWFSASFVVPQLREEWDISASGSSLLTISVQLGFVVSAVLSAATGLADRVSPRHMMCVGALAAAAANATLVLVDGLAMAVVVRFATGFFLAAVYPPALKEVSTWFRRGRGTALGVIIAALTLGSALPHLVNVFGGLDWKVVILATSIITTLGGLTILLIRGEGPYPFARRPFSFHAAVASLRNRDVLLANLGYIGHMWELYAMWAWVGALIATLSTVRDSADPGTLASLLAFLCIAAGALGCLAGGRISDRFGRAQSALTALIFSGGTAAALAVGHDVLPFAVVIGLCALWGFWVIADSAQFSALVTERATPEYVGGALSMQLAAGFTTTTVSLWLVPTLAESAGWSAALAALVAGPVVGGWAMAALIRRDRSAGGAAATG